MLPPSKQLLLELTEGGDEGEDLSALHVLARWTNIQRPVSFCMCSDAGVAVKGWSVNWLISVLECEGFETAPLLLVDDADVGLLLEALKGAACPFEEPIFLQLGQAISSTAFCSLLSSEYLPDNALTICGEPDDVPPYAAAWSGALELSTGYFAHLLLQAPSIKLRSLSVDGCQQVEDAAVVALARSAPELQHVELLGAARLGDAALAALAGSCPKLCSLHLEGAGKVTAWGVWMLLTSGKALEWVELRGSEAAATQLHAKVVALSVKGRVRTDWVEAGFNQWDIKVQSHSLEFIRKQG